MEGIPVFFGYSQVAIQEFIDDLNSYFAAKDIAVIRWVSILTKQLRGPAQTQHTAVLVVGQSLEVAVAATVARRGGAAVIAANSYQCHLDWLITTFHTTTNSRSIDWPSAIIERSTLRFLHKHLL